MLVLSRKMNQSIMIGEEIEVVVLEIKGDSVKIGLKAPRDIPVYRQEIYLEIKAENERAATSAAAAAKSTTAVPSAGALLKQALNKPGVLGSPAPVINNPGIPARPLGPDKPVT